MNIACIFVGLMTDIVGGNIHSRCGRKRAALLLGVVVSGCRPRWLVVALVLLGVLVVVLLEVVFNS